MYERIKSGTSSLGDAILRRFLVSDLRDSRSLSHVVRRSTLMQAPSYKFHNRSTRARSMIKARHADQVSGQTFVGVWEQRLEMAGKH